MVREVGVGSGKAWVIKGRGVGDWGQARVFVVVSLRSPRGAVRGNRGSRVSGESREKISLTIYISTSFASVLGVAHKQRPVQRRRAQAQRQAEVRSAPVAPAIKGSHAHVFRARPPLHPMKASSSTTPWHASDDVGAIYPLT